MRCMSSYQQTAIDLERGRVRPAIEGNAGWAVGRDARKLQLLMDQGAEPYIGSLQDEDFLKQAFKGAEAAYIMIPADFGAPLYRAFQNEVGEAIARGTGPCVRPLCRKY